MPETEQEPLLSPPVAELGVFREAESNKPSQSQIRAVYIYLALVLITTVGQAMTLQAGTDAEYLSICRYADIPAGQCFKDPVANDLEAILVSYTDVIGGVASIVSLLFASHGINVFGMKPVVLFTTAIGGISALLFWFVLEGPQLHYLWTIVPSVLSTNSFYSMAQFLSSIYVSEQISDATYRTLFLGWMEAVISGTEILGPAIGASLLGLIKTSDLYLIAAAFNIVGIVLTILFMKESHSKDDEPPSILSTFKLMSCNHIEDPKHRSAVRRIIAFVVFSSVVGNTYTFMQYIYVKSRFGWSAVENGWLSSTGQTIGLLCVAVFSPIVVVKLSEWYKRNDTKFDRVDSIMSNLHIFLLVVPAVLKALFPFPKAFFASQLFYKFVSICQPVLLNMAMKVAPQDQISSFWLGIVYLIQVSMIPVVLVGVNAYRHVIKLYPEALFWGVAAGGAGMFAILVGIPIAE